MNLANSFAHITGLGTTTIKSSPGELHTVVINTKGATANTLTLFNSLSGSGTVIGVIDTTSNVDSLEFDCLFSIGLTVTSAAGTGGDITITFR